MSMSSKAGVRSTYPDTESPAGQQEDQESRVGGVVRETVPVSTTVPHRERVGLVRETVSIPRRRHVGSLVRIAFGFIWMIDAYFKWQPSFLHRMPDVMSEGAKAQPAFLTPWFNFAHGVISVSPTLWAYGIALVETGIAVVLIVGFARKLTYVGGAVYSLLIWSTAEGLGRTSGVATDIGTAIIYAVVFLALLALDARGKGTRPYSLDAVIERHLPWWRQLAEVGS